MAMSVYCIYAPPVPADTETDYKQNNEYTLLRIPYKYVAVSAESYMQIIQNR